MSDELIETKCEICNRVVATDMYDNDYGGIGFYNHKTLLPHQTRHVDVPELKYGFDLLVCQDCIDKEPSLHSLILKHRKEWFTKEISQKREHVNQILIEIERLKESIPKKHVEIQKLIGQFFELR